MGGGGVLAQWLTRKMARDTEKVADICSRSIIGSVHKGSDELPLSPEVGISVSG